MSFAAAPHAAVRPFGIQASVAKFSLGEV